MCFSAGGSLSLSGVLIGIGGLSLARNSSKPYRLFAATPLLFAVQQATEGVVWLTIDAPEHTTLLHCATMAFLSFALVIWPVWAPLALQRVELDPVRHRILTVFCGIGALVSLGSMTLLLRMQPIAHVAGHSMAYDYGGFADGPMHALVLIAYILPTIISFFISTAAMARTIGATLVLSVSITAFAQQRALTSVWCFFAAILSSLILVAVGRQHAAAPAQQRADTSRMLRS